jgi:hypothetical protein
MAYRNLTKEIIEAGDKLYKTDKSQKINNISLPKKIIDFYNIGAPPRRAAKKRRSFLE